MVWKLCAACPMIKRPQGLSQAPDNDTNIPAHTGSEYRCTSAMGRCRAFGMGNASIQGRQEAEMEH